MQNSIRIHGRLRRSPVYKSLILLIPVVAMLLTASPSFAQTWDYTITDVDTPTTIDAAATTADVDTVNNEITLPPLSVPDIVRFWGSGEMDYVVLTTTGIKHYSFDGANMVENTILSVPGLTNPLALAAPDSFPDVVMADATGITHYSFTGSEMVQNPALSVSGLTGVTSVGAAGTDQIAALTGGAIEHYSLSGGSMARNSILEPTATLSNPVDISLVANGYDTAVLEPDKVRWFNFSGSGMSENTALTVTGLTDATAFAVADPNSGYDVAVVDGTQVKHFSFTGSGMAYNSTLSVTSGLTTPKAVAVRPGSFDRVIVDGTEVKYYQWNGSSLSYNSSLSVTVANIVSGDGYASSAVAQSLVFDPGANTDYVCVRAVVTLPDKTSVTWSVTADGVNWVKRWRVSGSAIGTSCEVTTDGGATWTAIGDATEATPDAANANLWASVTPGRVVKWKAELATTDPAVTPIIATNPRGGTAVRLLTNSAPLPPVLPLYGSCFAVTNPTLQWTFVDPDVGDTQSKYRVEVVRASDLSVLIDTGEVTSASNGYQIESSTAPDTPSILWSSGAYIFKYRVMVRDQAGAPSPWSDYGDFCVVAFERPRIAEIISPPAGQTSPTPSDASTHIVITPGMTQGQLPHVKAGAKVVFMVDSIGPITDFTAAFPFLSENSSTNTPATLPDGATSNPMYATGNAVNRWCVEFWTDGSLDVCPEGTVVGMGLTGNSAEGQTTLEAPPYSDGVVVTEGSIYSEWQVVLQGRDGS